ncbi:MAG: biotin-dependent carboxyltransferase family protein [Rhodobacteraceae bacterium]|nr:biotin-dependent carboxyltransferase family protein [Paracoccaceae bacterium]
MTGLRVIDCGSGTTVQDRGRFGLRRYGVSTSGTMDIDSAALANALTGNLPEMACIEFQMAGGRFVVEGGQAVMALSGPGCMLRIGGYSVPDGCSAKGEPGDVIEVGPVRGGVFAYLAAGGGFDLPGMMGSLSVHRRSGIGGRALAPGDLLPFKSPDRGKLSRSAPASAIAGPIRLVHGPQHDHFAAEALEFLSGSPFAVRPDSDRMACRLDGPPLLHKGEANIVSDGVLAGSIQVPGDGIPTILLRDCQTTGGYPKIATVISADLGRLAQVAPGGIVHFSSVTPEEAVDAARTAAKRLRERISAIRHVRTEPTTESLLGTNLVGGVTDGR